MARVPVMVIGIIKTLPKFTEDEVRFELYNNGFTITCVATHFNDSVNIAKLKMLKGSMWAVSGTLANVIDEKHLPKKVDHYALTYVQVFSLNLVYEMPSETMDLKTIAKEFDPNSLKVGGK